MRKKRNLEKGFTLLELLVVIALMGIIYSVTLSNYNGMNKSIELQNTAYNVALSIRETQVYGINKKLDSGSFSDGDSYPFGLQIDTENDTEIIIFKDRNPTDNNFDGGCHSDIRECERLIRFNGGNHISGLRVKSAGGGWVDFSGKLNILFKRPNPDAKIVDDSDSTSIYSRVGIKLSSQSGIYKSCVEIGSAGDMTLKGECN